MREPCRELPSGPCAGPSWPLGLIQHGDVAHEMEDQEHIPLKVEFGGGLELLFSNQRSHQLSIPSRVSKKYEKLQTQGISGVATDAPTKPADITYLLHWMRDNLLKERPELFMDGETMHVSTLLYRVNIDLTLSLLRCI